MENLYGKFHDFDMSAALHIEGAHLKFWLREEGLIRECAYQRGWALIKKGYGLNRAIRVK